MLLGLAPLVLVTAVAIGAVWVPPLDVVAIIGRHLTGAEPVPGTMLQDQIIWDVRVPRVLLAFLAGGCLALAGALLQAVVRNPLAEPYVLGVSAGAGLAAVAVLVLGSASGMLATVGVPGSAFAGALIALLAVVALSTQQRTVSPGRLLLAGVAVSYLCQAGTTYIQLLAGPNEVTAILFWLLGTLSGATWAKLVIPALFLLVSLAWATGRGGHLNALALGDDTAASLGISIGRFRLQLLVVSAALTASVVSVAGGIGFVGLVAPHCVRLLVGPEHRRLLPLSVLLGGLFLVAADLVARSARPPTELPLSVVTAAVGVPFFLLLLRRSSVAIAGA